MKLHIDESAAESAAGSGSWVNLTHHMTFTLQVVADSHQSPYVE